MTDLGYTPPPPKKNLAKGVTPVSIVSDQDSDPKPQYPSVSFNGEQAAKAGLSKCAHGDVYEVTVRIRATRIGGWNYPGSGNEDEEPAMEFELVSADKPKQVTEVKKGINPRIKSPKDMPGGKDAYEETDKD